MASSLVFDALKQAIPEGEFSFPASELYDQLNSSYLSEFESDLKPSCIFRPSSRDQVVTLLKVIRPFIDQGDTFAIRGGGQQPAPGVANINAPGITVDLSLIAGVDIDAKNHIVRIGAGERWGRVYEALDGSGLAIAGGRSNNGGIGGYALQGGLSFFSSREGFVCDNVLNYEIVLASGEVVNANEREHSDLWTALRGGGNNFGIVIRYDFRAFPQGPLWGGNIFYMLSSLPDQIQKLVTELTKPDASPETHVMMSIGFAGALSPVPVGLNTVYFAQAVDNPPVLDPFVSVDTKIDQFSSVRIQTLKEAATDQAAGVSTQVRCVYMNITTKPDAATLQACAKLYEEALEPVKAVENLRCSWTLQPYARSLLQKSQAHGGNSLGLNPGEGSLVNILLLSYWKNPSDDHKIVNMMKTVLEKMKQEAASRNQLVPYVYMNYAFTNQDPISSYGELESKTLSAVAKKYDSDGVFQKGFPEKSDHLGGHCVTYVDSKTKTPVDYGVVIHQDLSAVTEFFDKFGIPTTKVLPETFTLPDFRDGSAVNISTDPEGVEDGIARLAEMLAQYSYLLEGGDLPSPVPEDLLLPFGAFLQKYSLEAVVPKYYQYSQGIGSLLHITTISSNRTTDPMELLISSSGRGGNIKLLSCGQVLYTIPPTLENLVGWDLSAQEAAVFTQYTGANGYWTGVVAGVGLNQTQSYWNAASTTSSHIPVLPALYNLVPAGVLNDTWIVKFGADTPSMDADVVKRYIARGIRTLQQANNVSSGAAGELKFLAFESHGPFQL
ncbi:hypothetical protein NUW58_g1592 [Xylaria curta]|uniref:Uncharacterized protein n=1 Tax=Xylaria curta TaxID=42375 RepID=A0ACC1PKG5_9PEZI|nr:hypothetical protein NUW58_g1592 [Xylaria curta]